jgi:hypothetical protein
MSDTSTPGGTAAPQEEERTIDPADTDRMADRPDDRGKLIEAIITPGRTFATQQWCIANVASQPAGFHVDVGRIAGIVHSVERKPGKGDYPPYVEARGHFQATSLLSGEINTAPVLILPKASGNLLESAFQGDRPAQRVILDLAIGVRATGKSIPYTWTVRTFDRDLSEEQRVVAAIAARAEARAQHAQAAIEAPKANGPAMGETAEKTATNL